MSDRRVFVSRELPGDALKRLAEHCDLDVWPGPGAPSAQQLRARCSQANGLLCMLTDAVDAGFLRACAQLRVVSSMSVGLDHVDLAAALARGVAVGHTPGVLVETTADLAFGLLLSTARRIPEAERFVRDGEWTRERRWEPDMLLGRDVAGATLGVIGLGSIGLAVCRRARGFGMRVLGWNRTPRAADGVEPTAFPTLLAESDFISIHVALTPETRAMIGAGEIAEMKSGAVLINTARGGIVDETALAEALGQGHLGAAGLDVFEHEPLPPQSPLFGAPNLVLLPHVGSASHATRERMAELAVENLLAGLEGRSLPHDGLASHD
jgi:glyoxylate reductase